MHAATAEFYLIPTRPQCAVVLVIAEIGLRTALVTSSDSGPEVRFWEIAIDVPEARFWLASVWPTTRELGVSFRSSCWRVAAT
jgi:hypothetical protein